MASQSDIKVKVTISCQWYIINMMSGHCTNPIFWLKTNTPPPTSDNISFLLYPPPPPYPLKVDVVCVSPLACLQYKIDWEIGHVAQLKMLDGR